MADITFKETCPFSLDTSLTSFAFQEDHQQSNPNLKDLKAKAMDELLLIGDMLMCMIRLQERVKMLEEQAAMESEVLVNRKSVMEVEDNELSDESSGEFDLPDIEVRVREMNILIKVQCEKRKGVMVKIIGEVERLNMTVVSACLSKFGSLTYDITIVAEMEEDFSFSMDDILAAVRYSCID